MICEYAPEMASGAPGGTATRRFSHQKSERAGNAARNVSLTTMQRGEHIYNPRNPVASIYRDGPSRIFGCEDAVPQNMERLIERLREMENGMVPKEELEQFEII